jgi:hypothetical protein
MNLNFSFLQVLYMRCWTWFCYCCVSGTNRDVEMIQTEPEMLQVARRSFIFFGESKKLENQPTRMSRKKVKSAMTDDVKLPKVANRLIFLFLFDYKMSLI